MRWPKHDIFIADLHLSGQQTLCALAKRLFTDALGAHRLFILGDFVEYWIGDDIGTAVMRQEGDPELQSVFDTLQQLSASGTEVHLMHGNRDFLLGETFADVVGGTLHVSDTLVIESGGTRWLLMHGDTLCTDDVDYCQWRELIRSANWQDQFLARPPDERRQEAARLRNMSREATATKNNQIMDVNEGAVFDALQLAGVRHLMHGHTHRPAVHDLSMPDEVSTGQRLVLGDWQPHQAKIAIANKHHMQLISYP